MQPLAVADEFIDRLERFRAEAYARRMEAQASMVEIPDTTGVLRPGGNVLWHRARSARFHWLAPWSAETLKEVERWAHDNVDSLLIDVAPTVSNRAVATGLGEHGYRLDSWQPIVWRDPAWPLGEPPAVEVEEQRADPTPEFTDTFLRGYEWEEKDIPLWQRLLPLTWKAEGAQCYLARIDGRAVGAATLVMRDGIARLSNCCTLPDRRGAGAQAALIHARLRTAIEGGAEIITADARQGGSSLRNLARAGFVIAHHVSQWRHPELSPKSP
jgi:hypothetical protein